MTPRSHPADGRRLALITGASSGIGRELARCAAADGFHTVLVARREHALNSLARLLQAEHGGAHIVVPVDLGRPDGPRELVAELERLALKPNVLVNNAGIGSYGPFAEQQLETQLAILQVNVTALVELTHRLLPVLRAAGWGRVLNVASTAAFQPGPLMATYYASKAFVLSFSEALHEELHGSGLTVTALCPGPVNTEFQATAGLGPSRIAPLFARRGPEGVAEAGWRGCMRGKAVVIPGLLNNLHVSTVRVLPRAAMRRLVQAVQERTRRGRSD